MFTRSLADGHGSRRTFLRVAGAGLAGAAVGTLLLGRAVAADPCTPVNPCRAFGDAGAACTVTATGYTCSCDAGLSFNGQTCTPLAGGQCSGRPDGTPCNDGNACTQTDVCLSGVCVGTNPVVCTGSDQCHVAGTCNPATGQCSGQPAPDGTACNDGDPCTTGDVCKSGVCTGTLTPEACLDHFKCYTTSHVTPPTVRQNVTLHDQFESTTSQVSKVATICTPVDKNGEGIVDSRLHLVCYDVKDTRSPSQPPFPGATVQITNQFGQETMQVHRPSMLCVPSTKQVLP